MNKVLTFEATRVTTRLLGTVFDSVTYSSRKLQSYSGLDSDLTSDLTLDSRKDVMQ